MVAPRRLRLWQCEIGLEEMRRLTRIQSLRTLEELYLYGNPFGAAGVEALAACSILGTLRVADLSNCGIGDSGVAALARSPGLKNLESLPAALERDHRHGWASRLLPSRSSRRSDPWSCNTIPAFQRRYSCSCASDTRSRRVVCEAPADVAARDWMR